MGKNDKNNDKTNLTKWRIASLALELGFIIALPLVFFAFIGRWFDNKFQTFPWLTLVGIFLAIFSTTVWLTKKFRNFLPTNKSKDKKEEEEE